MATEDRQQVRGARAQSLFREVNERIGGATDDQGTRSEVLCECADEECVATLSVTSDEYEAVRRVPSHFVVERGHDVPEIERVVDENDRYVVVEKFGESGKAAVRLDPRRRSS